MPSSAARKSKFVVSARDGAHDIFALDVESVRQLDADGRLHVSITPISKANICGYYGREIPGAADMGLDPDRKYNLLRDPLELAKAASTFNGLPVMRRHVATSAADHKTEDTIGATGTDAAFEPPYLKNSIVIWPAEDIEQIEADLKKELSCGYRYRADMTPGTYEGEAYDGVMREIVGNHVALVREGRAGPDVVVGDEKPKPKRKFALDEMVTAPNSGIPMGGKFKKTAANDDSTAHDTNCDCADCAAAKDADPKAHDSKEPSMIKTALSPKATLARGALVAFLSPLLAEDAQVDLPAALRGVTAKNYPSRRPGIVTAITKATEGKLATDASIEGLADVLLALDEVDAPDLPMPGGGKGAGPAGKDKKAKDAKMGKDKKARDEAAESLKERLKDKLSEDEFKAACDDIDGMSGMDEEEEDDKDGVDPEKTNKAAKDKKAKDAKTDDDDDDDKDGEKMTKDEAKEAMDEAIAGERQRQNEVRAAERAVRPRVGDLDMAFDTAEDVYKHACEVAGIKTKGVHPTAFRAIFENLPKQNTGTKSRDTVMGMDAKGIDKMAALYPGIEQIRLG